MAKKKHTVVTRSRRTAAAAARVTPARGERRPASAPAAPDPAPVTVVGIGASAGGLEAFTQLIEAVPPDAGLALVLVQHLAPNQDSALPALLSTHTRMVVVQATDGARIRANHVYVIPPNVQMEFDDGSLKLLPRPTDRTQYLAIDAFFTSLAKITSGQPIAIVLSGTASDGAVGIRDVKAAGGITMAQQPDSAKFESMPRAAIATGMVDLILTPAQIGAELAQIARHPYIYDASQGRDSMPFRDDQLRRIFDLLRPASGVDFRHYKLPTIRRRLMRRMALHRITEIEPYIKVLESNRDELLALFHDLLIHVTQFFREPASFVALIDEVLPKLIEERNPDQPIRIWVCGCATGEEAYSLAILLVEFLQQRQSSVRVQIFATDVSETAIEHGRAGLYSLAIAADVGEERLRRFFTKTDGHYRVSKVIRDMVVFARQDLTRDPPFSRLDLVMCRNVLIYMDAVLQKKLLTLFHYALVPYGFLVLGQSETVGAQANLFSLLDKKHRIHRKKSAPASLPAVALPAQLGLGPVRRRAVSEPFDPEQGLQVEVNRIILDRYTPPGVVVDNDMQIAQFRGQTGPYLEPAPGEASLNLFKMAREGLLHGLRGAFHTVRKTKMTARQDGLQVRSGNGWRPVSIEVIPLSAFGRPMFLVLFQHPAASARDTVDAKSSVKKKPRATAVDDDKTVLLQRELAASREYLQSVIQELEAANEELQSANEEILSSNEELQSTNEELDTAKEELQSTNEELNTVNEELHGRNEDMTRINSDLMNLVGSVQIAIVIVGTDLRIRRFTPMAEKILNLIPTDLDRLIGHINPNINCADLEDLIKESIDSVTPIEREVQDRNGRWYSLRIRPYKTLENRIEGAVLALIDVDGVKRSERRVAMAVEFASVVLAASGQPMAVVTDDLVVRQANDAFAALFDASVAAVRGQGLGALAGASAVLDEWRAAKDGKPLPAMRIRKPHLMVIKGQLVESDTEGAAILVTVEDSPESSA